MEIPSSYIEEMKDYKEEGNPMNKNRVFTETELEELGKRTVDLVCEAIDAGDNEKAKKLSERMHREFQSMHDVYVTWFTGALSHIYEHYGDKALYEAMHQSSSVWFKPIVESYDKTGDFRHQVVMLAHGLAGHLQPMKVEEDDEKVCITMMPCGSGERLFQAGGYEPPKNLSIVKKPQPLTYGKPNCPIYCAHEAMLEILPIEWRGYPHWVCFPAEGFTSGGCRFCLYKNPEAIPEEVYTMVGKKKPKS